MTPTMKLRFVERQITVAFQSGASNFAEIKIVRILQQWWSTGEVVSYTYGEWRDVPLETEE